ncbi:MAG: 6-bladed beta-propeller [Cytophagaceae bacterium]|jgi:hypothetical protein|nr:6-bladed beta-propeller [Cytophagaceae bacterium]
MKWIMLLGILLVATSCTDKQSKDTNLLTINVKTSGDAIDNPFPYSHYVMLDTPDDVIIGDIKKLQIIGNNIYVMDNQHQSVFCFDLQGNYLHHLTKRGRSDKEYIRIEDFEVNPDNTLCIFDSNQKRIIKYDSSGNFINSMPSINGVAFKLLNDGLIAYNRGNGSASINKDPDQQLYNYACTRGQDIEINAVPFDKRLEGRRFFFGQSKNFFYEWEREIFMSSMLNDTIFKISKRDGRIEPYITFDMGNNKRANAKREVLLSFVDDIIEGKSISLPYNFQKNGNLLMIMYSHDLRVHTFIYDMETNMSINGIMSSNKYGLPFSPVSYLNSDNLSKVITLLEPHNIQLFLNLSEKKGLDTSILEELRLKSNENDNTILIFNDWPEHIFAKQ